MSTPGRILVGTSGFSYSDWVGPVYPTGTPRSRFLEHYRRFFRALELNYTYYRPPTPRSLMGIMRRSGPCMTITLKAHRSMTHEAERPGRATQEFRSAIEPLVAAGRLGAVLLQFPWSFQNEPESRKRLVLLARNLHGVPAVAEFRHESWWRPEIYGLLRSSGLGFCNVDLPELEGLPRPSEIVTGRTAYVRLHGRNAARWWHHEHAFERYDYGYSREELLPWVERIKTMARQAEVVFVFANNHYRGQAVRTAEELIQLLEAQAGQPGPEQGKLFE